MEMNELLKIEARCKAASELPWGISVDPIELRCKAISAKFEYEYGEFSSVWVARELSPENADFLCSARTDIPALIAALREAWKRIDEKEADILVEMMKHDQ